VAESLRKQIINSIRELVAEIGLTVDTDSLSFREAEFTLLKAVLQDAGILPIFHASESQELRIKKCYKAFADDRDIIIANNSMSLLEQQINYLKQIAIYEGITAEYNTSSSQLLRKLKLFNAVRGSLSGPCLTNAVAWHVLKQVQELSGGVWGIPDKLGDAARYVKVIGQPYAEFDGVAYGNAGNSAIFNFSKITIATRIKSANFGSGYRSFGIKIKNGRSWGLEVNNNIIDFSISGDGTTWNLAAHVGNTNIADNQWHNIVAIYDGTIAKVYIDGVLDDSGGIAGSINVSTSNVTVGANTDAGHISGSMQGMCIYDKPFTMEDIDNHNQGKDVSGAVVSYTFSESNGSTVYDTENTNNLTLINATLGNSGTVGDFWQYSDDATRKPEALLNGCFKRDDNNALVPKGVDTSGMTGTEVSPFSWPELPYTILYPADAWADDMDKDNTTNWETAGGPTGREWSYEQIAGLPAFKKDPVDRKVFRKKNGEEIFIANPEQSGACLEKTEKWAGEIVGAYLWVTQGSEQVYQNNVPVYIPN